MTLAPVGTPASSRKPIRKAVFPVAGLGTRFLLGARWARSPDCPEETEG